MLYTIQPHKVELYDKTHKSKGYECKFIIKALRFSTIKMWLKIDILHSYLYTGCPKKNETGFWLNISTTQYRIFKLFLSPEN